MQPALHADDPPSAEQTDDQPPAVIRRRRDRKARNVAVGDDHRLLYLVGQPAQPAAEDDGQLGTEIAERHGDPFFYICRSNVVFVHFGFLSLISKRTRSLSIVLYSPSR